MSTAARIVLKLIGLMLLSGSGAVSRAADEASLVFWAVNEGGARIYQPNPSACKKISGLSVPYAQGISAKLGVPAYTLRIISVNTDERQQRCALTIDTPLGPRTCPLGSVIRTFGGQYLAHNYQQFDDGRVQFLTGDCEEPAE